MPVKKKVSVKKTVRGPAASVSRRASSLANRSLRLRARIPSSASPLTSRSRGLSVPVYSLAGRASGTLSLPKEIFGVKVNKTLLSQAARIYLTNKKTLLGSTKTRGEVEGSTAKIYRQKGTGRARHGAIRAPIFVGGGITFGPKSRKVRLELPQRMRKAALFSALSSKFFDKNVLGISGIDKASGKTKEMIQLMEKLKIKSGLIVTGEKTDNVTRAVRNIQGFDVLPANLLNAYEVLKHELLLVTKEAVNVILGSKTTPEFGKKDSGRALLARMTKKGKKK
ncbi:MAG: 50S ribosomal protein L4 [Candidatus Daviesbacteria bacterium]|nr:50S ribosomal protein L4 [Candidatus Daviesbacteria bacterium]